MSETPFTVSTTSTSRPLSCRYLLGYSTASIGTDEDSAAAVAAAKQDDLCHGDSCSSEDGCLDLKRQD
jgi:hypothetical protein